MKATPKNLREYWNSRAREYPLPFDPSTAAKTRRILAALGRMGVSFTGRDVLDIGCGTGVYALTLAGTARSALGVDSSRAMLRVFERERRAAGIKNAACLAADWEELPARRTAGKFGVALASMTMAVRGEAGLLKMESAARGGVCVYIGWAGRRRNPLMEDVYAAHGLEYKAPEGAEKVRAALAGLGRAVKTRYISDGWTREATPEDTLKAIAVNMRANGVKLRKEWTMRLLRRLARGGLVKQRTTVRKQILVWSPPGR